jgi:DNA-binding transcriptional ArsR family regulator
MLHQRPHPVHELAAAFDISRPAVSRHLRLLKDAGVVTEKKQGRENVYLLRTQSLRQLSAWLEEHWADKLTPLKKMAETTAPASQMEMDL